jgi:hypothetical protein
MQRFLVSATVLACTASWVAIAAVPAAAASHALLIGIQQYSAPGIPSLEGPANDIALVRELLETRFQVPGENIATLADSQATHTGIEKAFASLAARVMPEDFVYIHYSGHGSEAQDENGDEEHGGLDQTWVSHGARAKRLEGIDDHDVLDDEINEWLLPLYDKTDRIVFVSDSCHSQSVSRGELRGVRAVLMDPRGHPLASRRFKTAAAPGARIGSARDIETAIETFKGGKIYGLFTWYWVEALNQARPGETWDEVFKRTYTLVTTQRGVHQRPQMEGRANWPVFGGDFVAVQPTVAVTKVDEATRTLTIAAGAVNGATVKSIYRLLQTADATPIEPPATIELTEVRAFSSLGSIKQGRFKVGDVVVEAEHAYPFQPIKVAVEGDYATGADRDLVRRIENAVKALKGFELVGGRSDADWVAYVLRPVPDAKGGFVKASTAHTLPSSSPANEPQVWVISPKDRERLLHEKMRIPLEEPDQGIKTLTDNLSTFARVQELKQLSAKGAPPLVTVAAFRLVRAPGCDKDCVQLPDEQGEQQRYRKEPGRQLTDLSSESFKSVDILGFAVKNEDTDPRYVYLLNIGPNAEVNVIFPAPYRAREHARVEPGESRDLSQETALLLDTQGTEMVKLVATSEPIDARLFELAGYREVPAHRGGTLNPLERLLNTAMHARGQVVLSTARSWGTAQVEFPVAD